MPGTNFQSTSESPRVLIVEDEPTIREFLRVGLSYESYSVTLADDGDAGIKLAIDLPWDLIILDLMLPKLDGLEICRRLRLRGDRTPIIMVTAKQQIQDRVAGLDVGADDYLIKPFSFEELLARIRAVLRRRGESTDSSLLTYASLTLDRDRHQAWREDILLDLTPREFALLELLIRHPGQVFSRETLLEHIWGVNYFGDANVVEVHISHLREKLGKNGKQIIRTIYGVGYTLRIGDD